MYNETWALIVSFIAMVLIAASYFVKNKNAYLVFQASGIVGSVFIDRAGIVPTITHYEWVNGTSLHQTYRLSEYTETLEKRHSLGYYDSTFSIKTIQNLANQIVGEWISD